MEYMHYCRVYIVFNTNILKARIVVVEALNKVNSIDPVIVLIVLGHNY